MKNTLPILQLAIPTPLRRFFDYLPPKSYDLTQLKPGMRLKVPFGRRELTGIFIRNVETSTVPEGKLKQALAVLDTEPVIPTDILELATKAANYYQHPIGEVLLGILPTELRQGKPLPEITPAEAENENILAETPLSLNPAQADALSHLITFIDHFTVTLLHGVTGSGKTEVYLQAIEHCLKQQKQILVLVPEIGLTPQLLQRFRARFTAPIVAIHSGMTNKSRLTAWLKAKSGEAKIIIGTRSAVFTPLNNLGMIIVDEEHDLSFKQQDGFHYHARDVAILRASQKNIPIVLGSATPSLETLQNARTERYHLKKLPERAGLAMRPTFHLIDVRNQTLEQGLSKELIAAIEQHLKEDNQVMLFLNRRGYAPILLCHSCGWMATCSRCDMRMTWHRKAGYLLCHHCDKQTKVPSQCKQCGGKTLQAAGQGTEQLEETLSFLFPDYPIERIDRDSTRRKGEMEKAFARIQSGEARILTGTQMLAKGHHFPNVTLVAIVDADGGFFSADFRALERMGQQVLQVAGRAGRAEKPGTVMIQTHHPDHPLLYQLLNEGYAAFSDSLLQERAKIILPPFTYFALFRAEANQLEKADAFLKHIRDTIAIKHPIQIMGPIPAPIPRRAGRYRAQLLLQSTTRPALQNTLKKYMPDIENLRSGKKVRWSLDVDPLEIG
ncbi:MAG: primosomal protein N' [Gammaproteobacteria bacterium]|nr:primosomal protein N' [Gammaproteobacteria bacterium]